MTSVGTAGVGRGLELLIPGPFLLLKKLRTSFNRE